VQLDAVGPPVLMTHFVGGVRLQGGVGASCRRERFDQMIALDKAHVRHLAREYMAYHHADRTHDGLGSGTPSGRAIEPKPAGAELISLPRVGGLHHRYLWKAAA